MKNIIDAISEIVKSPYHLQHSDSQSHNRANSLGESLEEYIKDVFAGTVNCTDKQKRAIKHSKEFSYLGNNTNPPDLMIKRGIAIEVKKIETFDRYLHLNSSHPKALLFADSPLINKACRECENWSVKEMLYCVGVVDKQENLKGLAIVYGEDYCADKEVYERVISVIKSGVESIPNVEFAKTKELGRINRVDPLGITYMRVRGMWGIENPFKVYSDVFTIDHSKDFNFMAIINKDQLQKLSNVDTLYNLQQSYNEFNIIDIFIKDPNNPAKLKEAVLISYKV